MKRSLNEEGKAFAALKKDAPSGMSVCLCVNLWKFGHKREDTLEYSAHITPSDARASLCSFGNTPDEAVQSVLKKAKEADYAD